MKHHPTNRNEGFIHALNISFLKSAAFFGLIILALMGVSRLAQAAERLDINEYLKQVSDKNGSVKASTIRSSAAELRSAEGKHTYYPVLFAETFWLTDRRPTNNPLFQGNKTTAGRYSLGVSQQAPWGMQARLSYNIQRVEVFGVSPTFFPLNPYYESFPMLELSQPLWGNFLGAGTRARVEATEASLLSTKHQESFNARREMADAEQAYWRLVASRKLLKVRLATLQRAQDIKDWSTRRVRLQLADRSDLLQAEAALQLRKLDVEAAQDEERAAARLFNTTRGISSDVVEEELDEMDVSATLKAERPGRKEKREDVLAAEENSRALRARATANAQAFRPSFDVTGSYALYGRRSELSDSISDSFDGDRPYWTVGLNFSMPLDFGIRADIREGFAREQLAADTALERRTFEVNREWEDLAAKFDDYKKRLELASTIESAQKEKLLHEKERLKAGRTTTYQVLLFEQDYSQSQISRILTQLAMQELISRLKLFSGDL